MNTIKDLCELIAAGKRPVVTFKEGIGEKESYAEAQMRARIVGMSRPDVDGVLKLKFSFPEFEAHNTPLESTNYWGKGDNGAKREANLTCKQAGFYKPEEDLYFDLVEIVDDLFTIESEAVMALFETYVAQQPGCSYVSWLDARVLAAQA